MTTELKYMSVLYKGYMIPPDKIPLIVSNMVLAGYFFGDEGLAVVSFLMTLFFLFEAIGYWINYGAFAKSIEAVSRNETELARSYSSLALTLSVVAGIILSAIIGLNLSEALKILEVPAELLQMAGEYGLWLAFSGFFLTVAQYFWQFVKMIGFQARIRKIYLLIMFVDVLIVFVLVKIFELGISALALGMIGTELFIIGVVGMWLKKSFRQNLFGKIQDPLSSIFGIISAGSTAAGGKFFSLALIYILNLELLNSYGVGGVAVFAAIQTAMRICRLHSQVTWQPLLPILTMEHGDRNVAAMLLLLKHSLKQAVIMAILPALVIYFGAGYFSEGVAMEEFAFKAFQAYSLSVVFAAVTSIFLIAYSILGFRIFANVIEFLRTLVLIVVFLRFTEPALIFWSFLFAEVVALMLLAIGAFLISSVGKLKTPLLLSAELFKPELFLVVDRSKSFSDEENIQLKNFVSEKTVKFLSAWLELVKKFSDAGKNNFTAIHIRKEGDETRITLRSMGKLFDYSSNDDASKLLRDEPEIITSKLTFTLGLNNLYLRLKSA